MEHLPEVEARRQYGLAQLAWVAFETSPGKKQRTELRDWLPPFARVASERRDVPPAWRADLAVGTRHKWLRQELLDAVMAVCEV